MVRPDRLERPTFWFVATNQRAFIDLAVGTMSTSSCSLLRVIKQFRDVPDRVLAKLRNASLQGVGTKMGTVLAANRIEHGEERALPGVQTVPSRMSRTRAVKN